MGLAAMLAGLLELSRVPEGAAMGDAWRHWAARTSFVPFARQVAGVTPWGDAIPRAHALAGGFVLWLAATWAHIPLAGWAAGIWRWLI